MSGLTSYHRTPGDGRTTSILGLRGAIDALREGVGDLKTAAIEVIRNLRSLSINSTDDVQMVAMARDVRDALLLAKFFGADVGAQLQEAMEICAKHWIAVNPILTSGFAVRAGAAVSAYLAAKNPKDVRLAHEVAGTIATLYHISALLGEDLEKSLLASAQPLGNSRYTGLLDGNGVVLFLESGASYNVNLFVKIFTPGVAEPFVVVGEAKGGGSGYGSVAGPSSMTLSVTGTTTRISQTDYRYAVSRAHYMANDNRNTPEARARRQVGKAIKQAANSKRLAYITARGVVESSVLKCERESFKCI